MNSETQFSAERHPVSDLYGRMGLCARDKRAILYIISLVIDCLCLLAGYLIARTMRDSQWLDAGGKSIVLIALPIFLMLTIAREVQSVEALESRTVAIRRSLGALGATALAIVALTFVLQIEDISRLGFLVTFGSAGVLIIFNKLVMDKVFQWWMRGSATANILLLDGVRATPNHNMDLVDVRLEGLHPDLNKPDMIDSLSRIIAAYDRVVVACPLETRAAWATFLKGHDVGGEILVESDVLEGAVAIGTHGGQDTLVLSRGPLSLTSRIQKRAFDLVVASAAVIALAPLMVMVAILIKLETPGPVFFRQVRVGQGNRHFMIYKFRSMRLDLGGDDGRVSARRDDDRVTRVGRFIRRTSLDELPQLFNVLRGHMSIVGPRPHALGSLAGSNLFWEVSRQYWIRHAAKPGITGLAQIRGLRGATDSADDLRDRIRADLEYLAVWSIANDLLILMRTLRVLVHKNAY